METIRPGDAIRQRHYLLTHREGVGLVYRVAELDEWGQRTAWLRLGAEAIRALAHHDVVSDPMHWLSSDGRVEPESTEATRMAAQNQPRYQQALDDSLRRRRESEQDMLVRREQMSLQQRFYAEQLEHRLTLEAERPTSLQSGIVEDPEPRNVRVE